MIPPQPRSRAQRAAVLLLVVAAHALLLLFGWPRPMPPPLRDGPPRITVRLLAEAPQAATPAPAPAPATKPVAQSTKPRTSARATASRRTPAVASQGSEAPRGASAAPSAADTPGSPTPPVTAAASAPQEGQLIDSGATRRTLRDIAREKPMAEQAALASSAPPVQTAQTRLAQNIAHAGKGDCAKGQYLGSGMGLLSLPFLVAATLRDQCAR